MLTLLVLLNALDTELSRSKPAECSWRPLALLPYGKKSRQVMTPEAFAKTSARSNLVYLISSGKVHLRNAAEHIRALRQSTYLFFLTNLNIPKHPEDESFDRMMGRRGDSASGRKASAECAHSTILL